MRSNAFPKTCCTLVWDCGCSKLNPETKARQKENQQGVYIEGTPLKTGSESWRPRLLLRSCFRYYLKTLPYFFVANYSSLSCISNLISVIYRTPHSFLSLGGFEPRIEKVGSWKSRRCPHIAKSLCESGSGTLLSRVFAYEGTLGVMTKGDL